MPAPTARSNVSGHRDLSAKASTPVAEADSHIRRALGREGFAVLDEVAGTGFGPGSDVLSNRIPVTYHAILARRAIEMDPDVGLVSPTSVVMHADGEMTGVQVLDAVIMADRTQPRTGGDHH